MYTTCTCTVYMLRNSTCRCLVLLAELYSELDLPAMALPHVMDSLAVCENSHLPPQQAKLCLAQLQVHCIRVHIHIHVHVHVTQPYRCVLHY